jgi:fibro-slime domain-containing protein
MRNASLLALGLLCACAAGNEAATVDVDHVMDDGDQGDGDGDGDGDDDGDGDGDGDGEGDGDGDGDGDDCGNTLHAIIRDFDTDHPDFENDEFQSNNWNDVATPGLVESELGADQKPVYASEAETLQTSGPDEFSQWYQDVDGVNEHFEIDIELKPDPANGNLYTYDNQFFFPIDGMGFGNEGLDANGEMRNFWFTTEIHTKFEYRGGEVFTFNGDDDLWLFINGKLAIDLGGLHPKLLSTVNLDDQAAVLGITKGKRYTMDIFHAERHTDASTFHVETSIGCIIPVIL